MITGNIEHNLVDALSRSGLTGRIRIYRNDFSDSIDILYNDRVYVRNHSIGHLLFMSSRLDVIWSLYLDVVMAHSLFQGWYGEGRPVVWS